MILDSNFDKIWNGSESGLMAYNLAELKKNCLQALLKVAVLIIVIVNQYKTDFTVLTSVKEQFFRLIE